MQIVDISKDLSMVDMAYVARSLKTICIETDYQYLRLLSPKVIDLTDIDEMRYALVITDVGTVFISNVNDNFQIIVINDVKSKVEFLSRMSEIRMEGLGAASQHFPL